MKRLFTLAVLVAVVVATNINVTAQDKTDQQQAVYTIAILPFSERATGVKDNGAQVADLLFAGLAENPNLWIVERAELDKILKEAELNLSGVVNPAQATQIGQLTGAKILVTGSVFKVKNKTFLVAKIIGTETSRVLGKSVNGTQDLDALAMDLAKQVSETITKDAGKLMPKIHTRKDTIASLKKALGEGKRAKLFIEVKEKHVGQVTIDPAVQTELQMIAQAVGFEITDQKDAADVVISGDAFSEFATRRGNLISVKARAEIKATDKSGKVVAVDRQTTIQVDLAEQIAGKKALQKAGEQIAERLLPKLIKK